MTERSEGEAPRRKVRKMVRGKVCRWLDDCREAMGMAPGDGVTRGWWEWIEELRARRDPAIVPEQVMDGLRRLTNDANRFEVGRLLTNLYALELDLDEV